MKKYLPFIIVALIAAGGLGAYLALKKDTKPVDKTSNTQAPVQQQPPASSSGIVKACDVLTQDIAKKVLGSSVAAADTNTTPPSESDDLVVSNCNYSIEGATLGDNRTVSLLVRSPKTSKGTESNQQAFGSLKPANAQDVSGYGESAFWNPDFGQFNVLKDNTWYIVSKGSLKPTERDIEETKAFAATLGLSNGF